MADGQITRLAQVAYQQLAAEAFLSRAGDEIASPFPPDRTQARLTEGNTHASRFLLSQAAQFTSDYEVLAQYRNDPLLQTGSGFSGTLFRTRITDPARGLVAGELTLSFRSSEFIDDAVRDGKSTNQLEIRELGWAFGQIAEMEAWYQQLRADPNLLGGRSFNVTGYSLGGHLATAFNILRREAEGLEANPVLNTYTFNGAGVGELRPGVRLTDVIRTFNRLRAMPDVTESPEWNALSDTDLLTISNAVLERVNRISQETARVGSPAFVANFAFDTRPPAGEQGTTQYQIAALLAAQDTIASSLFFGTDVNTIPTSPRFAEEFGRQRFQGMLEIVGSDAGNLGPSFVSNSGVHYGTRQEVYIEDQPLTRGEYSLLADRGDVHSRPDVNDFADTHSLVLLVDSLSLLATLETLAPDFTFENGRQLLAAMSNARISYAPETQGAAEGDTLERTLDAFRNLLIGTGQAQTVSYEATLAGNTWHLQTFREPFFQNLAGLGERIAELNSAPNARYSIRVLASLSSDEITALAERQDDAGLAARYALRALNPFSLEGASALYERPELNGVLDLQGDANGSHAGMTREYVADRAAMLGWLMHRNVRNEGSFFPDPGVEGPLLFTDLVPGGDGKQTSFRIVPQGSTSVLDLDPNSPILRRFVFGTDLADRLSGGPAADRLYGGLGTDVLAGRGSDDYLEGGAGLDLYAYSAQRNLVFLDTNDGADTIRDTDGRGVIRYTLGQSSGLSTAYTSTVVADASDRRSATEWRSADGAFIYTASQNPDGRTDLTVTFSDGVGGSIALRDFQDGDFGIRLGASVGPPAGEARTFYGDRADWDSDPNLEGVQHQPDGFGNHVRADGQGGRPDIPETDRIDEFFGSDQDVVERFATAGGNDIVRADGTAGATGGADLIEAGAGRDVIWTGPGADFAEAGPDGDVVNSGPGNDAIYGSSHTELATAIRSSETAISQNQKGDFLSAGDGNDRLVGSTEDDALLGGAGDDVLIAGAGSDNLWGDLAHGSDSLAWSTNRSILPPAEGTAGQGAPRVFEIQFSSVLAVPLPSGGRDVLYGGAGDDWSFGGGDDDFIDAGSGADVSFGQAGSDILIGAAGNDVLSGDDPGSVSAEEEGGDYLDGGLGNDELFGNGGEDILVGGPGADTLVGGAGKDFYVFGKGDGIGGDIIFDTPASPNDPERSELVLGAGFERSDIRFFPGSLGIDLGSSNPDDPGAPHDVIHFEGFNPFDPYATPVLGAIRFADGTSMSFDDILAQGFEVDGTDGSDSEHSGGSTLRGTAVVDRIRGFAGDDLLVGLSGDDVLDGGDGADELQGGDGNDALAAGAGVDRLFGEAGNDELLGGAGTDALVGDGGADTIAGGEGADSAWGGAGDDSVEGGDDDDTLYGDEGRDTMDGGSGDDTIYAHTFVVVDGVPMLNPLDDGASDVLRGGEGNDYLNSGDGADLLEGGAGDDVLQGGAGNDLYVFNPGDARDTIYEAGSNTVTFGAGIVAAELTLWQTGSDLNVGHADGADVLTIANWYALPEGLVSEFEFSDGSVWTGASAGDEGARYKRGTAGGDAIFGTGIDEAIDGLAGNDQLFGNGGADTLVGGLGDDTANGGNGADVYRFGLGDGRDVLMESGQGADTLYFGFGIAKGDIQPSRSGVDLVLTHVNGVDRITIQDWFNDFARQIESIRFEGTGEAFTIAELTIPFLALTGTQGADFLWGGNAYGETIVGLAGNDDLRGGGGDDSLTGGLGNDLLFGEGGNDRYFFVAGDGQDVLADPLGINVIQFGPNLVSRVSIGNSGFDKLISFTGTQDSVLVRSGGFFPALAFELEGTNAADNLIGSEFKDIISALGGDDSVKGGWGVDEIHGGPGNDTLEGGRDIDELWGDAGDDVLDGDVLNDPTGTDGGYTTRFHGGPGADTLYGHVAADSYYFDLGDGHDTIVDEPFFGNGQWNYSFNDELLFGVGIAADAIAARPAGNDLVVDVNAADRLTLRNWFSDPKYRIEWFRFSDGTSFDEAQIANLVNTRSGTSGNDALVGSDSAGETMFGRAGNDTLTGLGGDDVLDGGTGNDLLDGGVGNDTYVLRPGDGFDLIRESAGSDEIRFGTGIAAADVALERSGNNLVLRGAGGDAVSIENYLRDAAARVEAIVFGDGSSLPDSSQIVEQLIAIRGTAVADSLSGTAHVDALFGFGGNDTLSGGADNDLLDGGPGLDRYLFNPGDGVDTITDQDSGNLVQFGAGIAPQNVATTRVGDDLLLSVSGSPDRLSIPGYFLGYPVAEFRFADGTSWGIETIKTKVTTPTSGPDTLIGFETSDLVSGLAGADTMYGRGGNDTLDGGLGSDTIHGEEGDDLLIGGTGESKNAAVSNSLFGGSGDDVLIGGGNANSGERLDGGPGADLLLGGVAQEIISDTGYDSRNSLLFGGSASDSLRMYGGAAAFASGGAGSDSISGGLGAGVARTRMVVAFNKADGIDTVDQLAPGSTLTIGGGTLYGNLSLEVAGGGLRLKTASNNYVYLSDWYSAPNGSGKTVSTLQLIIEGTRDYKPASSNPMNNAKIVAFDFIGLVNAFDAARASGRSFDVAANLPSFRLWSSDTDAIGGSIAYQYARTGNLGALTHAQMRAAINSPSFGNAPQAITATGGAMAFAEPLTAGLSAATEAFVAPNVAGASTNSGSDQSGASGEKQTPGTRGESIVPPTGGGVGAIVGYTRIAADVESTHSSRNTSSITAHEVAWRRIARDLPALLENHADEESGAPAWRLRRALEFGSSEVTPAVVPAIGLGDHGGNRLLRFEGLREGFARLGP